MKGCPLAHIPCIDVRARGKQKVHTFLVATLGRQMQRGAFLFICPFKVCPVRQQELYDGLVVIQGREMQRGALLVAVGVDVCPAVLDQNGRALKVTVVCGVMEGGPPVGVHVVQVSLALNDGMQGLLLGGLLQLRENCLVNWSLTEYAHLVIDLIATVDKMLEVLDIRLICSIVKVLKDTASEFILSHLERSLSESR